MDKLPRSGQVQATDAYVAEWVASLRDTACKRCRGSFKDDPTERGVRIVDGSYLCSVCFEDTEHPIQTTSHYDNETGGECHCNQCEE